jgi:hypothetical protein
MIRLSNIIILIPVDNLTKYNLFPILMCCFFVCFLTGAHLLAQIMPPPLTESAEEPIKYIGKTEPDKYYYHGRLRDVVGVHRYQVYRANRSNPPEGGNIGWTYNHAPMLAYWQGKYYLQYLSNLKEEHNPPGRTLILTSIDGREWSIPKIVFPEYPLPEIKKGDVFIKKGTKSVMHQRMGFYIAPNGRLLTLGFYSYCPTPRDGPNQGHGLGRVVREIYNDGNFGPIFFIRYNQHAGWNENNTRYEHYKKSKDNGFIAACDALLSDKLKTLQWWEEDRSNDGFYTLDPGDQEIKALSYFRRPDSVIVALWKNNLTALSADEGRSWTNLMKSSSLKTCSAKLWGQETKDKRYAIVYNHSATERNRFPLVVISGNDGHYFDNMLCVHGEVPPMRYQGLHKNVGLQYVRGIVEGNGDTSGNDMWITYSMNKEDIWVSRINLPIRGKVEDHVYQDFNDLNSESDLNLWNFHIPKWAKVNILSDRIDRKNKFLTLTDEDPYDYALAERIFPERKHLKVQFCIKQEQVGHGLLEFEVYDQYGNRPLRLRFDPEWLSFDRGKVEPRPVRITTGNWYCIKLIIDCAKQIYDVYVDEEWVKTALPLAEKVESVEKLVFRTGPWRGDVRLFILDGEPGNPGLYQEDLPGADQKVPKSVFFIDDIKTNDYNPADNLLK